MDSPTLVVSSKFAHQYCSKGTAGEEVAGLTEATVGSPFVVILASMAISVARRYEESIDRQGMLAV